MARGINKEEIFSEKGDKKVMLYLLKKYQKNVPIELHAYCIMGNHIHLLLKAELTVLSKYMSLVLGNYADYYNRKKQRCGYVFQNRFKSQCIEDEKYYWSCVRYIHLNPVKANLSTNLNTYPFSSFREYSTNNFNLIHDSARKMYENTFEKIENFRWFHRQPNQILLEDVEADVHMCQIEMSIEILKDMQMKIPEIVAGDALKMQFFRTKFREEIKKNLHLSDKKADALMTEIEKISK